MPAPVADFWYASIMVAAIVVGVETARAALALVPLFATLWIHDANRAGIPQANCAVVAADG